MALCDWSSDVCSSDLTLRKKQRQAVEKLLPANPSQLLQSVVVSTSALPSSPVLSTASADVSSTVVLYCTYSTYVPYSLSPYRVLNSDTASALTSFSRHIVISSISLVSYPFSLLASDLVTNVTASYCPLSRLAFRFSRSRPHRYRSLAPCPREPILPWRHH